MANPDDDAKNLLMLNAAYKEESLDAFKALFTSPDALNLHIPRCALRSAANVPNNKGWHSLTRDENHERDNQPAAAGLFSRSKAQLEVKRVQRTDDDNNSNVSDTEELHDDFQSGQQPSSLMDRVLDGTVSTDVTDQVQFDNFFEEDADQNSRKEMEETALKLFGGANEGLPCSKKSLLPSDEPHAILNVAAESKLPPESQCEVKTLSTKETDRKTEPDTARCYTPDQDDCDESSDSLDLPGTASKKVPEPVSDSPPSTCTGVAETVEDFALDPTFDYEEAEKNAAKLSKKPRNPYEA